MGFLGVYRAVYDYVPQGDTELAISEGDLLYVLEKSGEDDWWKAKKKAAREDEDEPEGLIPNNYVEEAQPIHKARALYDYTRQTDEEISFTEDAQLEVFDTSDPDWTLVGYDKEYGFAPANYIEIPEGGHEEPAASPEPPAPSLPRRPPRAEEDAHQTPREPDSPHAKSPAAAMAGILNQRRAAAASPETATPPQYTPDDSDNDEGPALPARPSLQISAPEPSAEPRSPPSGMMASPPYNRASVRRADDDETPVHSQPGFHMYNINEMVSVMGKRKKMPTTLGINSATGIIMIAPEKLRDGPEQTWTAEKMTHYSIEGKHVFLELVRPSKSIDFHAGAKDTAYEIVSVLGELAGAVRAEGLREVIAAGSGQSQRMGKMLYDFMAQGDDEVTVAVDDEVILLDDKTSEEWWKVRRIRNGKEGVVPSSYVEITGTVDSSSSMAGVNAAKSQVEQNRLEEERMAKESLKVAREEDARGSEVGPGVRLPERGSSLMAGDSSNNHGQRRGNAQSDNSNSRSKSKPDPKKVRTWTDRSKTFKVEAQFLGLKDGKINLHKTNGIKIAVPVDKMAVEDLEYVERITGESLDEDKPLGSRKRNIGSQSTSASRGNAGATIEHPKVPEYDWFQFFLSCEVAVGLCENYSQTFNRGSMDESVLPDVDSTVLRSMGIREGDIIKIMRYLDKKYGRVGGKRNLDTPDGDSPGGLFSGPGGALRNNTRKGRPAPAVQTNDVVDPKAFSQDTPKSEAPKSAAHDGVPTPLATAPVPEKKDVVRAGFDDDAWSVKPAASQPPQTATPATTAPAPAPSQPALTGSMQELTLLTQPLQPTKVAPPPQPVVTKPPEQQGPPPVTPSIFQGIGNQQTGLPAPQQNIARQRPAPPPFQNQGGLIPPAPSRPLSAPHANQPSGFPLPPLQAQSTGIQSSSGFQQIAPPGQSLDELRLRQQYAAMNPPQNMNMNMGLMPQPTGFQYNGLQQPNQQQPNQQQPNGFQYPMQTGMPQQISPMQQPPMNQLPFQQQQPQPTGFQNQSPFGQQAPPQFPQPTGVNAFLQPALQPTPTGIQQNPGFASTFTPPPVPPMPPQLPVPAPLTPQKTGPAPPVRFGVNPDAKKLAPQPTGRRANLSQATPQNPFGF